MVFVVVNVILRSAGATNWTLAIKSSIESDVSRISFTILKKLFILFYH